MREKTLRWPNFGHLRVCCDVVNVCRLHYNNNYLSSSQLSFSSPQQQQTLFNKIMLGAMPFFCRSIVLALRWVPSEPKVHNHDNLKVKTIKSQIERYVQRSKCVNLFLFFNRFCVDTIHQSVHRWQFESIGYNYLLEHKRHQYWYSTAHMKTMQCQTVKTS